MRICRLAPLAMLVCAPVTHAQTQPAGGGNPQNPTGVYTAAYTLSGGTASQTGQTYAAASDYEFGVYVTGGGALTLVNPTIATSGEIGNGVEASLNTSTTSGTVVINGGSIATTGIGGNGIFAAAGNSAVSMTGGSISCAGQFGHGVLVTYGGSVTLDGVTITTKSGNGAALANDAGGGTVTAINVIATTNASGSPGIYSIGTTTVITVTNSTLIAKGEAGAVATGGGTIIANNSSITGTTAGVRTFNQGSATSPTTIDGGSVTATAGDAFLATGASAAITVKGGATLSASSGNLVNSVNSGSATFIADGETLAGNLVADSTSSLAATLQNHTKFTGVVTGGALTIDATSVWTLSGNSVLTSLSDANGISGSTVNNIAGNGHNVTYNASLSANSYLNARTYALAGGGYLLPSGTSAPTGPVIFSGGIVNAASYVAGVAPGAWISIFGTNLAASTTVATAANLVDGYLPASLGGTSVTIDGKPAYLTYVSSTQIDAQAPNDWATGNVTVTITNASGSVAAAVAMQAVFPGLFTASYSAPFYALAVRLSDGVLVDGATVAATAGDLLAIYATGLDGIAAAQAPGLVFTGTYSAASLPSATVGGTAVTISSCDLVGTGVYRIVLTVPGLPAGTYPLIVRQNGVSSDTTAVLRIATN